jgi:TusA-related sulfurtransferase
MNDRQFVSDLRVCYEILLYLASRMAKLAPGESFEFVTSDPEAMDRVPDWCDTRGFQLLTSEALPDGRWRFLIQK